MSEIIFAAVAPFLMIVFITRVTYNHYVSSILTVAIIAAIYKGYSEPSYVVLLWLLSSITGFFYAKRMNERLKREKGLKKKKI